jgi:tetratricopeptide (TPR) repeat protein
MASLEKASHSATLRTASFLPGYLEAVERPGMTARARVVAATIVAACFAAVGAVAVGALQGERSSSATVSAPVRQEGRPPLVFDLGVREDDEARALRQGLALYQAGNSAQARQLFEAHDSLEARVGAAFARWPDGTLDRLNRLAGLHQQSAVVQLHLGLAQFWAGEPGSTEAWEAAAEAEPDTLYAVAADNVLFPSFAPKLPVFIASTPLPAGFAGLAPAAQLRKLERESRATLQAALHYGAALQRLGRQLSAERVYREAASRRPNDAEAQVAAAVGLFDKSAPTRAFSKLGPLTRRFPNAATVRFHLAVLLLWSGSLKEAKRQFELAQKAEPGSPLAREAAKYLASVAAAGR